YYVNTVQLGFYNLAGILISPSLLLSQSVATTMFRYMAASDKLARRLVWLNTLWLIASAVGIMSLGRYIVGILFGSRFAGMDHLVPPLALAAIFQGMYQPYNVFLA